MTRNVNPHWRPNRDGSRTYYIRWKMVSSYRLLAGGSWGYPAAYMPASDRGYVYPAGEGSYYGFRVAEIPEPATLALLAIGGLAMLRRRRK